MKKVLLFSALAAITVGLVFSAELRIVSPNGGETDVCLGKTYPIKWTAMRVSQKIKLILFRNNDKMGAIAEGLNAGSSPFNWQVGQGVSVVVGGGYRIRVRTMDNDIDDFSNNPFEIKATCDGGKGDGASTSSNRFDYSIDPGILEKFRRMDSIAIKWPPAPDPCLCPEFNIREIHKLLSNYSHPFMIHLLKNGVLVQSLGLFHNGMSLPDSLKENLNAADSQLLRNGNGNFSLALIARDRKILWVFPVWQHGNIAASSAY